MRQTVEAVFEGGLLRPLKALNLQEGGHVQIVIDMETATPPEPKYDFSALRGTLRWQGDALAEQRRVRDEW